jgi:hypothetical protein
VRWLALTRIIKITSMVKGSERMMLYLTVTFG